MIIIDYELYSASVFFFLQTSRPSFNDKLEGEEIVA